MRTKIVAPRRRLALGVFLTLGLLQAGGCATANRPHATLTPEQINLNVQSFDYVWTTIRDKHWDPQLGGLDWPAVRDELRPQVQAASTMAAARAPMLDMIGRLKQSHFNILPGEVYRSMSSPAAEKSAPSNGADSKPDAGDDSQPGSAGIDVRVVHGEALVFRVSPDSSAERSGVKPGWRITKIDERDVAQLIQIVDRSFEGSSLRELRLNGAVAAQLRGPIGRSATIDFEREHNEPVRLALDYSAGRGTLVQFGNLPPIRLWFESRTIAGNIGYVAFSAWFDPASTMKNFGDAIQGFMNADGVIIDLRGNPGGLAGMAMGMAGWFVDESGEPLGTMYTRQTPLKFAVNSRVNTYGGPVAILVDGSTGSTSEIFAGGMRDLKRARIFGTRSAGAALPSNVEKLPNGDGFQYAIANYISAGGETLEGHGVEPDETVELSREGLLAGRDAVIEAAVAWIRTQPRTSVAFQE